MFYEEYIRRDLSTEMEFIVHSLPKDRRADVLISSRAGKRYAIELQHSPIDFDELVERTRGYIAADVRVIWIPFLRPDYMEQAIRSAQGQKGDLRIERFPPRPLERWVHGFYYGNPWMYYAKSKMLYRYAFEDQMLYEESKEWYDESGNYQYVEGGEYPSKKWKELVLWGPYRLDQVGIRKFEREEKQMGRHYYPGGQFGKLVLKTDLRISQFSDSSKLKNTVSPRT